MNHHNLLLTLISLLTLIAAGLLALSRTRYEVSLGSVVEIWADIMRDADRVGLTLTRVSATQEEAIGREIEQEIARQWGFKDDPVLQAYVSSVGESLIKNTQRKTINYRFYIVASPMINAFAVPGGGIYITTGMLDFLKSEAELAGILGHEVSHVDLRHSIERLQYELAARKIGGKDLALIARFGYSLVEVGFSKQQELEADAAGALLAAEAGYDAWASISTFERLSQFDRKGQGEKPTLMVEEVGIALRKALGQYFATHPPTDERIRQLKETLEQNATVWRGKKLYVGVSNYSDQVPGSSDERPNEWQIRFATGIF